MNEREAQAMLAEVASTLRKVETELAPLPAAMPVPANQDAMLECEIAPDVATEVASVVEYVLVDYVRPAIAAFERTAAVNRASLEHDFRAFERRFSEAGRDLARRLDGGG